MARSEESKLLLAIYALQKDPNLSVNRAAKLYGVSYTTLRNRRAGRSSRRDTNPKRRKLSSIEESAIINHIIDLALRGFPPRVCMVRDMADRILAARHGTRVGTNWTTKFIRRQPQLKTRYNRRVDYQRAYCEDPIAYKAWFTLFKDTLVKYGIAEADIYNFDETGFAIGVISATGMVVTSSERLGRPRQVQQGNREWATVVSSVGANGFIVPPYIILSGKVIMEAWYRDTDLPRPWRLAVTDNGWINNEQGLQWITHFDKHTKDRTQGVYRLLILDGHVSHHSDVFETYCKAHNIITLCMPAHTSHRLQPLDVGCFGPLKLAYSRQLERLIRCFVTHVDKVGFLMAIRQAWEEAITLSNIQGGFRGSGLVPFDPEKVISTLDVKLATPRESPGPELPSPWAPQTPYTTQETTNQYQYIKDKVERHHSSSPTPILNAMEQLNKGMLSIMHAHTLLAAEVDGLRKANATLSKRRQAKATQLPGRTDLSIEEYHDLMAQQGVEAQLQQDIRRHGLDGEGPAKPIRLCSKCRRPGHTKRTCQLGVNSA